MSQAEDLLNSLTVENEDEEHIVIDKERVISVPQSLRRIAVQHDDNVRTVTFDCPRYYDGRDLSQMIISINYMCSDGKPGMYLADNIVVDETDDTILHFDWTIKDHVTEVSGSLSFLVCAKKSNAEGIIENHWNSELNQEMTVSKGLECIEQIIEKYPDIITQILMRLRIVESKESFNANGAEVDQVPTADGKGNWSWKGIEFPEFPEPVTDEHIRELITGYKYSTFSGSYNDLSDKPEIPEQVTDDHIRSLITGYGYSTFSGSYNDLTDKPEIPESVTDDHIRSLITGYGYSTFSGSYNDLSDKPSIPVPVTDEHIRELITGYGYSTFSGSYNDLSDKPEIPEQVTDGHIRSLITSYANAYTDQNAAALLNYIQSIIRPYELTWFDGYRVSKDDGSVKAEVGSSYCDFVSVRPGDKLIISNTMTVDTEYNAFYNSNKNFVSSFSTNNGNVVTVPDGAKYFRLSKHNQDMVIVMPEVSVTTPKESVQMVDNTGAVYNLKIVDGKLTVQEVV